MRPYQNNTRMFINNHNYQLEQTKRNRMVDYWQAQIVPNHLPPLHRKAKKEPEKAPIPKLNQKSFFQQKLMKSGPVDLSLKS